MTIKSIVRTARNICIAASVAVICAAIVTAQGCDQAQIEKLQAEQKQAVDLLNQYHDAINDVVADKGALTAEIQKVRDQLAAQPNATPEQKAAWDDQIKKGEALLQPILDKLNGWQKKADDVITQINDFSAKIAAAKDPSAIINAVGTAAAPLSGPYAPFVLLGTNVLSMIVSGFVGRRSGVAAGVTNTVVPLENNRDVVAEAAMAAQGKDVLVINKNGAMKGHLMSGVATAIEKVTRKIGG